MNRAVLNLSNLIKSQNNIHIYIVSLLFISLAVDSLPSGVVTGNLIMMVLIMYFIWRGIYNKQTIIIRIILSALSAAGISLLDSPLKLSALIIVSFTASGYYDKAAKDIYNILILASSYILIFFACARSSEVLRIFIDNVAVLVSKTGGYIIGRDISLGPTYSGANLMFVFLFFFISVIVINRKRLLKLFMLFMILIPFLCTAVYNAVWSLLSETPIYSNFTSFEPLISPFDYRIILFLLLALPLLWVNKRLNIIHKVKGDSKAVPERAGKRWLYVCSGLMILFTLFVGIHPSVYYDGGNGLNTVSIYSTNDSPVIMDKPVFQKLGIENVGMFGMLPQYLESEGYKVSMIDSLDGEKLKDTGVLVMVNLMNILDKESEQAVWEYVKNGGSLLVLGDHTGTEQIREPFNRLLEPVGISFDFDSAIPFKDLWRQGYVFSNHPVLKGLDWHEIQINIGASLSIKYPARAVITGRYGYGDAGNINNPSNGYLGDMQFNRGERLGDLVLAAEAEYGNGKVFVFGDTSPLQVVNLPYSYNFADRLFSWMTSYRHFGFVAIDILCLILLFLSLILVSLFINNRKAAYGILIAAVILSVTMQIFPAPLKQTNFSGKLVGIDGSSASLMKITRDKQSIDGFIANIERNGYLPFYLRQESDFENKNLSAIVVIAPASPFSSEKEESLKSYMKDGGVIIMAAGWREYYACSDFLGSVGLGIKNVPLGRGEKDDEDAKAAFWEAWALSIDGVSNSEVLANTWDYPVSVYVKYGEGGLVLVGDSQFFNNKNLEDINYFNQKNIYFIRDIFRKYVDKK